MSCSRFEVCGLPQAIHNRVALLLWQRNFCEDDRRFPECRRFQLAQRGEPIPDAMLPSGYVLGAP
jgi:hypothetical protein